ncbi:hypothetical protein PHYBLDRAFT_160554 [Phycomyces blakesleeanus NRRL 1555(-)]|uniref:THUMP domain-containing protein n=2 Tax=Phycomyces blakesleeanus TaxID=4837 RepID=A0A167JTE3_PHYB8|nr:hypothetical protein PHYBLDRAFT_160554 [Phycomyces blakesleeanus NRRL 1555(-)]OAD66669.1 hypothetical protein PHYBLDRAFT_160554 [Phycomyces blakesleeanus NRRL 1555(-)]|eukprot:XP_018284709.1 hypothetical protein PHYBLDRAFT_160554 [Phycomyces blakesleeanus NRRL 1555(-)]
MTGVMVTCTRGKEPAAVKEITDVFYQYAETLYPEAEDDEEEVDEDEDIEATIAREVAALKKQSSAGGKKKFSNIATGTTCLAFIKTAPPVDPCAFVHQILTDMNTTQVKKTRYISRLLPVQNTCKSSLESIEQLAKELVAPKFNVPNANGEIKPRTFAVMARIRNCTKLDRMEVTMKLAGIVGQPHVVDLTNPELMIIVEVIQNVCMMSIVEDFYKLKKYNIESLLGVNDAGVPKPIKAKVKAKEGDKEEKEKPEETESKVETEKETNENDEEKKKSNEESN